MKLLIISGTPKTDGITRLMVVAAREAAVAVGVDAEIIELAALKLQACRTCADGWGACYPTHLCEHGQADGFNALQEKFRDAAAYVFITPVYWGEVSEALKHFLDRLRRCQATKQWDKKEGTGPSYLKGKPSILVANAGGGGGGIVSCFEQMERALQHMGADANPRNKAGIFDYIAVNRWNHEYKRETVKHAVAAMVKGISV
ncbi:MAG: flavodoxin family protein [Phycisphaerales bacterium]|nr:flavodoxin family protein [Phycisphaerales bacterium]